MVFQVTKAHSDQDLRDALIADDELEREVMPSSDEEPESGEPEEDDFKSDLPFDNEEEEPEAEQEEQLEPAAKPSGKKRLAALRNKASK